VEALFYIVVLLVSFAISSVVTGYVLYFLAPLAGWSSEEQRKYWRGFGFNWGWATPVPCLLYWLFDVFSTKVLGRGSMRKSDIRPAWVRAAEDEQPALPSTAT
jgi:hypothetical protein